MPETNNIFNVPQIMTNEYKKKKQKHIQTNKRLKTERDKGVEG